MAEEKLDERLISGTGLLRIPDPAKPPRYFSILIDVIRDPSRIFLSNKYDPKRQRYATMTYLRDGYVLSEHAIDYPQRRFDEVIDICGQELLATKCSYQGTLESFANLGTALNLTVTSVENKVKPFTSLDMFADAVHFVCEGDCAIQVRLMYDHYDTCDDDEVQQKKPPPPPAPLPKVPTGTPIGSISRPYDVNDTTTSPNVIDNIESPPPFKGGQCNCVSYYVVLSVVHGDGSTRIVTNGLYGPITRFYLAPAPSGYSLSNNIMVECKGSTNDPVCGNTQQLIYYGVIPSIGISSFTVISVDGNPNNCGDPPSS